MDYKPTACLSDEEGKALLDELDRLEGAVCQLKPPRRSHRAAELDYAVAELQIALIKAALKFARHQEFTAWLVGNHRENLDADDPLRGRDEQLNKIRDLEWRVGRLEEVVKRICDVLLKMNEAGETSDAVIKELGEALQARGVLK
jgi:hypothetical protein